MKKRLTYLFLLTLLGLVVKAQQPTSRVALVIGVQNYTGVPPLRHSIKDATDMSNVLKAKGFKVETLIDPKTKKQIKDAITRYYNTMSQSSGAIGIIYYAGHGTQHEGENYLIPATASLQLPGDLDDQCVKMNLVMSALNSTNDNLNIFLLDACRTNNFTSFSRDIVKGLANVESPKGSIVVFATQPGTVASDGTGTNGLFTSKLLKYINEPNLNISDMLRKVKRDVNDESEGRQLPSVVDNSLGGEFYFTQVTNNQPQPNTNKPANSNSVVKDKENDAKKTLVSKKEINPVPENKAPLDYGYGTADAAVVTIGNKIWIAKNLNVSRFSNGDAIPEAKTPEEWQKASDSKQPAWCYYKGDTTKGKIYGKLYNWYAVSDARGLAPKGWHVTQDEDWKALVETLGDDKAGMTVKSNDGWLANGNNSSGLTVRPGGLRYVVGEFADFGKNGYWWSSNDFNEREAMCWEVLGYSPNVGSGNNYKGFGFAVRCVKD
ncbi:hypothetical protein WSM22_01320 [Cytophagales bacterium WSM2-2]|nr:hypothetical protein WSM22_01320 [Cytophagales bacterium WSM2-2]